MIALANFPLRLDATVILYYYHTLKLVYSFYPTAERETFGSSTVWMLVMNVVRMLKRFY